jgi:hypothetical protein
VQLLQVWGWQPHGLLCRGQMLLKRRRGVGTQLVLAVELLAAWNVAGATYLP